MAGNGSKTDFLQEDGSGYGFLWIVGIWGTKRTVVTLMSRAGLLVRKFFARVQKVLDFGVWESDILDMGIWADISRRFRFEVRCLRSWFAEQPPIVTVCAVIGVCLMLFGVIGMEVELFVEMKP